MGRSKVRWAFYAFAAVAGGVLAGCTDEQIVFRDRELFTDPPAAAAKFLGYSKEEGKATTCGNCHIGQQSKWEQTKHAGAWETLASSGHAQAFCETCHTVSESGNAAEDNVGWVATKDTRYYDVQCESCHGAGLDHVLNASVDANKPLASMLASTDGTNGCGECHNGEHHPFVEQWEATAHGRTNAGVAVRPECASCHEGKAAMVAFGVNGKYLEMNSSTLQPITCTVCHDPHANNNPAQLRFAIDVPNEDQNLCMKCHHKRGVPDMASQSRGPHSPQGPLLLGEAGWIPPNMDLTGISGTHGSQQNPRLCAGCHVNKFEVTDAATGAFVFQAVGHDFAAIPCVDANGKPTGGDCDVSQRTFRSCTASGCHGSENAARSAFRVAELRLEELTNELLALIAKVPASERNSSDTKYTTAEGAMFNAGFVSGDLGVAAHNPFLVEALLTASIRQVKLEYGVTSASSIDLNNILQK